DVAACDAGVDGGDLAAGHQLGFLDRAADGGNGGLDVDHHALAQALRRVAADADDVDAVLGELPDDGADLRRPDVQADDDLSTLLLAHVTSVPSLARLASALWLRAGSAPRPIRVGCGSRGEWRRRAPPAAGARPAPAGGAGAARSNHHGPAPPGRRPG